jgi:flagellar biogenesis protein FliO
MATQDTRPTLKSGRGITVLSLLLLIIALVLVAIFLVRYLRTATS